MSNQLEQSVSSYQLKATPNSLLNLFNIQCYSDEIKNNTLGDAQLQISYAELPLYFETIEKYLQKQNISPQDYIAFECQNTTVALIFLLALLYRGQHLLLLPSEGNPMKQPGFKPNIPTFCKIQLTISSSYTAMDPESITRLCNSYPHTIFDPTNCARMNAVEPLLLIRTSGSMGDAKIVCFTQKNLLGNASRCIQRFGLEHRSRITIAVPIFHMYGLGAALIPAILVGASIDIQANTNILRFLQHERNFNPDTIYLNPTICTMLLKGRRQDKQFKQTISAGAVLPQALALEYHQRFGAITNLYGSSEMGVIATVSSKNLLLDRPTPFIPLTGVVIQINTVDNALYCLHPNGFNGYLNSQGEALDIQSYPYNTGDRAEMDNCVETGFKLLGRQGNSTNRSGFLVQFDDIEKALCNMIGIDQVVVLTSNEETIRGEKLYAFCITENASSSSTIDKDTIRKACFEILPKYAVPDEIILQQTFPLAPSGKIDRQALKLQMASESIRNS